MAESSGSVSSSSSSTTPSPFLASASLPQPKDSIIVVVDDIARNIQVVGSMLRAAGYQIVPATTGAQALRSLASRPADLVLCDVMMPEMDGFEVTRRIKANPATADIPVIMLTAATDTDYVVRGLEAGAVDYVGKPFNATELLARVRTHIELRHSRQALRETARRLASELEESSRYVRSILPPPVSTPFNIDWELIPCSELGGDSFGYGWLDQDNFALYVLDVRGHGVAAALLTVAALNVLRAGTLPDGTDPRNPARVLNALNEIFLMEKHNGMYFTVWYGVYNVRTRKLTYANAGHPPSLLVQEMPAADGSPAHTITVTHLEGAGLILGAMSGFEYEQYETTLPEHGELYLISDGTYEVSRPDGSMVPMSYFLDFFTRPPSLGVRQIDALVAHMREVNGPGHFDDDFTVVRCVF
ncbi:MAG: PP2C family protein-serine/threonine phosphatase [Candidatus Methylacidiphilales bacterium]